MQNLPKYPASRNFFLSRRILNSIMKRDMSEKRIFKLWNCPDNSRALHRVSYQTFNRICREYKAVRTMLTSSGFLQPSRFPSTLPRLLATSSSNNTRKTSPGPSRDSSGSEKEPPGNENEQKAALFKILLFSLFIYGVFIYPMTTLGNRIQTAPFISWNEFVHQMLAKGEVQELIVKPDMDWVTIVLHDGAIIKGRPAEHRLYQMIVADATHLEEKLREAEAAMGIREGHGVSIVYERSSTNLYNVFLVLAVVIYMLALMTKGSGKASIFPKDFFSGMTRAKFTLVDPLTGGTKNVRFADVAGLKEAKVEVMEFVDYLKRPEFYKTLGAKVPKGALLLGPPGCGKTMLAKAVATEANVPFLSMNGSEFIEMIGGLGAARVRDLFKEARKRSPSILYIDEIDAIGKKRSGSGSSMGGANRESEQTLNQLLVEMDGMATKDGVIVLASTNRAEVLDKALLRPGRFDRHILIDLPTLAERKEIFERHLKGIVLERKPENYSPRLAQLTPGMSGADIANICNEAALHAARFKKKVVDADDLSYAIDRVLCGPEKKDHGVSPTEKKIVAYHESGHALVAWLLKETDALLKVTIKPRTKGMLGFAQYTPTERRNFSKEQIFEMMCTALGGRAAENIIFDRVTTGAQNDLEKVTKMAYAQVRQFGMGEEVGLVSFTEEETGKDTKKPYSKKLGNLMDAEARLLVGRAYKQTEQLLRDNMDKLELMAQTLLKQETLTYEQVEALIGPPPFGSKKRVEFIDIDTPPTVGNVEEQPE
ncbi:paraplegin isoform X2 [Diachasmimorpha longicaudata]|uniref:paraplegin isoform X2 n=1 Tax=Diachasmimorpha longicaudata TaxID=58733 RepID=UPI0030B8DC8D